MDVSWIDKKIPDPTAVIKNKLKNIITLLRWKQPIHKKNIK